MPNNRTTLEPQLPLSGAAERAQAREPSPFNLPNQLTASRLLLGIALFALIECRQWFWCLLVFAAAALTDWLDGYLARLQNLTSSLGRNFDPLVDKVLICGAFIFLLPIGTVEGWLTPWMVTLVVGRELIITSLRSYLEQHGAKFGADWLGKLKMGLQCGALFAIFIVLLLDSAPATEVPVWIEFRLLVVLRAVLIYAMLASTALSGLQYLWKATQLYLASRTGKGEG